nr:MAG TPA: hypothetical protein [Caudoviricetes sp.]
MVGQSGISVLLSLSPFSACRHFIGMSLSRYVFRLYSAKVNVSFPMQSSSRLVYLKISTPAGCI